jgi:hypothetical protein
MRALWKGTISFGLVSIPILLYPATRREEIKFHLLRVRFEPAHFQMRGQFARILVGLLNGMARKKPGTALVTVPVLPRPAKCFPARRKSHWQK